MLIRLPRLSSALLALGVSLALASVGCGPADATREPEEADGGPNNPASDIDIGDPGLGDKSPGQPSPWDHIAQPVKTTSVPVTPH